jgi:hypothetical protein
LRIHIPIDETDLRDLLDRILDKGLFCGMVNLMLLGDTNLSDPDNRISVFSVDTNTRTYAGRQGPVERRRRRAVRNP